MHGGGMQAAGSSAAAANGTTPTAVPSTWTTTATSSQRQAWAPQSNSSSSSAGYEDRQERGVTEPTRSSPISPTHDNTGRPVLMNPTSNSQKPAGLSTAQLLQFVGLSTNYAEHLAPQKHEQKRRVRPNKPTMPPVMPVPTLNRSRLPQKTTLQLQSGSQLRNNNVNKTPVVPKPVAPLPANLLIEGLPTSAKVQSNSNYRTNTTSTHIDNAVQKATVVEHVTSYSETNHQSTQPRSILANSCQVTAANSNIKRMTLKDYKSREDVAMDSSFTTTTSTTSSPILNFYNAKPKTSSSNSISDASTFQNSHTVRDVADVSSSNVNHTCDNGSMMDKNKTPKVDKDGFVIPNASHIPDHTADHTLNGPDESNSSDEELVIDECAATKTPDEPTTSNQHTEETPAEEIQSDEETYEMKSATEISEISHELDDLYQSLTTDGSLLMDKKLRKKVKKLLRKQNQRERRLSTKAEDDSSDLYSEVNHVRHCADDVEDLECSSSENEEEISEEPQKFKSLKQNIVRKYRQRELEEEERVKKMSARKKPLSDGELSEEGELSSSDEDKHEQPVKPSNLYSNVTDSDWVEEMPGSPNELKITFTVKNIPTSVPTKVKRTATLSERAGGFKGMGKFHDALMDILKSIDSNSQDGDKHKHESSKMSEDKTFDVIEIYDKESFLDNENFEAREATEEMSGEEGLLSDSEEEFDNGKWRRKSKSSRQRHGKKHHRHRSKSQSPKRGTKDQKKHSKSDSRSPSPTDRHKEKRHRKRRSRSGSPRRRHRSGSSSPKRRHRSRSKSPKRRRRSRSRSRSPSDQRRSGSQSPSRWHRGRRTRSRSQSEPRSPSRTNNYKDSNKHSKSSPRKVSPQKARGPSNTSGHSSTTTITTTTENTNQATDMLDCNLEEYNMEISSGDESPQRPANIDDSADPEVARQLEEAMEKLQKMEQDVSRRQVMIEELESKSQSSQASDEGDSRPPPLSREQKHDVTVVEDGENMDDQLMDAVHRLQRMEENYSRRQLLLNNLRQTMLETEREFKAADPDLIEVEDEEDDSADYIEEVQIISLESVIFTNLI